MKNIGEAYIQPTPTFYYHLLLTNALAGICVCCFILLSDVQVCTAGVPELTSHGELESIRPAAHHLHHTYAHKYTNCDKLSCNSPLLFFPTQSLNFHSELASRKLTSRKRSWVSAIQTAQKKKWLELNISIYQNFYNEN